MCRKLKTENPIDLTSDLGETSQTTNQSNSQQAIGKFLEIMNDIRICQLISSSRNRYLYQLA